MECRLGGYKMYSFVHVYLAFFVAKVHFFSYLYKRRVPACRRVLPQSNLCGDACGTPFSVHEKQREKSLVCVEGFGGVYVYRDGFGADTTLEGLLNRYSITLLINNDIVTSLLN